MLFNPYSHHYIRNIYSVNLCQCLGLGLYMSYLCEVFFIFSLIFIDINHITSFKQTYIFCVHFLDYRLLLLVDNVNNESEYFSNNKSSSSRCCLVFACFFVHFSLALLIKVLLLKKACLRLS